MLAVEPPLRLVWDLSPTGLIGPFCLPPPLEIVVREMSQIQYSTLHVTDIAAPNSVFVKRALDRVINTLVTAARRDGVVRLAKAVTVTCSAIGVNCSPRELTKTPSSLHL